MAWTMHAVLAVGGWAMRVRPPTPVGLKPKDLIGVPWRLAFALQDDGWWLRSEVVWSKPNAYPESVRDRPTTAHETVHAPGGIQPRTGHAMPRPGQDVPARSPEPFCPRAVKRTRSVRDDHRNSRRAVSLSTSSTSASRSRNGRTSSAARFQSRRARRSATAWRQS